MRVGNILIKIKIKNKIILVISKDEWDNLDADTANNFIKKKNLLIQNKKLYSNFVF